MNLLQQVSFIYGQVTAKVYAFCLSSSFHIAYQAVEEIVSEKGFLLPCQVAMESLEAAKTLYSWCIVPGNQQDLTIFANTLHEKLRSRGVCKKAAEEEREDVGKLP